MKRLFSILVAALLLAGCAVTPTAPDTSDATTAATTITTAADPTTVPTEGTTEGTTAGTTEGTTDPTTAATTDPTTDKATAPTTAATSTTKKVTTTKKRPSYKMEFDLFADNTRADGMIYTHSYDSHREAAFSWSSSRPKWLYSQVGGKNHIVNTGTYESPAPGVHYHETAAEQLYIDTNTGLIKMNIFGNNYFEHTRRPDEGFAGMLLTPLELTGRVYVNEISSLNVKLDFLLEKVECHIPEGELRMDIHTIGWYYYVFVCDNYSTDWFYVGLPFYDWRSGNYPDDDPHFDKEYLSVDPYTGGGGQNGTPVYIPAPNDVWGYGNSNRLGERFTCDIDILPYVKEAFEKIQKMGRFAGRSLDTFYINGCNLGWEIPGTFSGWATVYQYEMTYTE